MGVAQKAATLGGPRPCLGGPGILGDMWGVSVPTCEGDHGSHRLVLRTE